MKKMFIKIKRQSKSKFSKFILETTDNFQTLVTWTATQLIGKALIQIHVLEVAW